MHPGLRSLQMRGGGLGVSALGRSLFSPTPVLETTREIGRRAFKKDGRPPWVVKGGQSRFASTSKPQGAKHAKLPPQRPPRLSTTASRPNLKDQGQEAGPKRRLPLSAGRNMVLILGTIPLAILFNPFGQTTLEAEAPRKQSEEEGEESGNRGLRTIRLEEVKGHGAGSGKPWVTRGTKVYDITDWVEGHPGGEVILRAAGGSVDPYYVIWKIFSIHQKKDVYDILESYLIGIVDPRDLTNGAMPEESIEDPFSQDPSRDNALHTHSSRPCNAETPSCQLTTFITPNNIFYVRNHMWVPTPPAQAKLEIELSDGEEVSFSLRDLKEKFPQHTITSTLQCSGNRRSHMTDATTHTSGLQWTVGAIGTATWTGPLLRDVLEKSGMNISRPPSSAKHVQFTGHEAYGASVPIEKALNPYGDVILAHSMNNEPIPKDHGSPLRVIVPGHVAARSVKWLKKITVSDEESTSQWQRRDYKCFGPNESGKEDWGAAKSIQEMPVNSAVTSISEMEGKGTVVKGWAYSGGGREIVRVDVSVDDGKSWDQACIGCVNEDKDANGQPANKHWAWKQWHYTIPTPNGNKDGREKKDGTKRIIAVKATDEAYNTQPEHFDPIYNVRGNLAAAWHRVPFEGGKTEVGFKP
ncbi:Oxidoreductase, molybdopterin-binding domain-containing protein [Amylocarpus encephaloides]|uniref:Nitrate reductase [NADPH] n=1 Tax=Amylocarpus encephaloides TaxID=45428 RepID=A0A9P7Y9W6_9HELO|nr:Oxidoreductase, molybdopterin-binding domain-containing protein [Amylocarpus encephaloides]